jgi:hypothetical protein
MVADERRVQFGQLFERVAELDVQPVIVRVVAQAGANAADLVEQFVAVSFEISHKRKPFLRCPERALAMIAPAPA